jgi:hypothetical protein
MKIEENDNNKKYNGEIDGTIYLALFIERGLAHVIDTAIS